MYVNCGILSCQEWSEAIPAVSPAPPKYCRSAQFIDGRSATCVVHARSRPNQHTLESRWCCHIVQSVIIPLKRAFVLTTGQLRDVADHPLPSAGPPSRPSICNSRAPYHLYVGVSNNDTDIDRTTARYRGHPPRSRTTKPISARRAQLTGLFSSRGAPQVVPPLIALPLALVPSTRTSVPERPTHAVLSERTCLQQVSS